MIAEIKRFGGSNVYSRLIAMKCRGTSSLLRDVYLGGDRPWGIEPAQDPEVPQEIIQAIGEHISQEVTQLVQAHFQAAQANQAHQFASAVAHAQGAAQGVHPSFTDAAIPSHTSGPSQGMHTGAIPPGIPPPPGAGAGLPAPPPPPPLPDPSAIRDRYDSLMEGARDQARRKAADQAKIAEEKLQEHLAQGGFYTALAEFLVDLPLFPYACITGPTVRIKTQVKWTKDQAPWSGQPQIPPQPPTLQSNSPAQSPPKQSQVARPQVVDAPILCWERVSPFDLYWTPGVSDIEDGNVIQRSRLTRSEINDLLDLPGFITEEVRAVLDEYGRGGLVDNWDTTDAERSILESREDPRFNQSGLIACIEFQGNIQGRYLLDLGMDPSMVPDPCVITTPTLGS